MAGVSMRRWYSKARLATRKARRHYQIKLTWSVLLATAILLLSIVPAPTPSSLYSDTNIQHTGKLHPALNWTHCHVMVLGIDIRSWRYQIGLYQAARCHFLVKRRCVCLQSTCLFGVAAGMMVSMVPVFAAMLAVVANSADLSPHPEIGTCNYSLYLKFVLESA